MRLGMRSKGTAPELEARRRTAIAKHQGGWSQAKIAAFLDVHPVTVAKWVARHRLEGDAWLAAKPTPGRPRFLTVEQEQTVLGWLADKPTAHDFPTDLWTARRVADLIRRRFGVAFHADYLRAWLRERGYSPQKPRRRARQRNQPVIDRWVNEDWPRIQKKRRRSTRTSS
jgi:transposase